MKKMTNNKMRLHHKHTNAFIDMNGIPYLLAEYVDKESFQQVDRSLIRSEIFVDTSEAMRSVIDISIDDIGKRGSDGLPAIVGNNTKQKRLLKMIENTCERLNHKFDVLRRGIIMRVNYQLENQTTGQVIRSAVEDLRIPDRSYFLDINPRDINDNAIITNFSATLVSTVNQFTHGRDRMILRITNVQMLYECLQRDHVDMPYLRQFYMDPNMLHTCYGNENDFYRYHDAMQHKHTIGISGVCNCNHYGYEDVSMISPPTWSMFSRYYRFDNGGRDICLHGQEINDPMARIGLLPCGSVQVNRAFMINPGQRLIFKFSVWKNDVTIVNDTTPIAQAIKAPLMDCCHDNLTCDPMLPVHPECGCHDEINPDYETVIRMLRENRHANDRQNYVINQLVNVVNKMQEVMESFHPPVIDPIDPTNPDPNNPNPGTDPENPDNPGGDSAEDNTTGEDKKEDSVDDTQETL